MRAKWNYNVSPEWNQHEKSRRKSQRVFFSFFFALFLLPRCRSVTIVRHSMICLIVRLNGITETRWKLLRARRNGNPLHIIISCFSLCLFCLLFAHWKAASIVICKFLFILCAQVKMLFCYVVPVEKEENTRTRLSLNRLFIFFCFASQCKFTVRRNAYSDDFLLDWKRFHLIN